VSDPQRRADGADSPHEEPVIRDRRRLDPNTGALREQPAGGPGAGSAGPSASTSPFPGAGRHSAPDPADPNDAAQPLNVDLTAAELDLARQEAAERTADLQRITAEYANYRKRVDRDREAQATAAKSSVVLELLPILDDLDRAREHDDLVGPAAAMADQLTVTLGKFGLSGFGEVGDPFDPTRHEAVSHETSAEVTEPTCTSVMRRGYMLGDRLLRAALVGVADPQ
jgi:molecular chaperone GrpE